MTEPALLQRLERLALLERQVADEVDRLIRDADARRIPHRHIARAAGITENAIRCRKARGWKRRGYIGRRRPQAAA